MVWSLVFLLAVLTVTRGWSTLRTVLRSRRSLVILAIAAVAITVNWTTYVYAVSTDQVVESSLGYFINPLVSVLLAVVILRERLRRAQWTALGLAAIGVVVIAIGTGATPIIGLLLAFSFGTYGLMKKMAGVDAISSLTVETGLLLPFAAAVLAYWEVQGSASIVEGPWNISLLLVLLGPVTAIPLLAYVGGANRLPLSTLGILQYSTPTVLLVIGITVFGEPVNATEWCGFAAIWCALAVFTHDMVRHSRRGSRTDSLEVAEPA